MHRFIKAIVVLCLFSAPAIGAPNETIQADEQIAPELDAFASALDFEEFEDISGVFSLHESVRAQVRLDYQQAVRSYKAAHKNNDRAAYETAIALFQKVLRRFESASVYSYVGSANLSLMRLDAAHAAYLSALHLDAQHGGAWRGLAFLANLREDHPNALEFVDKAIKYDGPSCTLHARRGRTLVSLGRFGDAQKAFIEGLEKFEPCADAAVGMSETLFRIFLAKGGTDQQLWQMVIGYLNYSDQHDPDNLWARQFKATLAAMSQQAMEEPKNPKALAHLNDAEEHFRAGRLKKALRSYKKAAAIEPESDMIQLFMGDAYFGMGRIDEAIEKYLLAISLNPKNFRAYRFLGDAYVRQQRFDQAREAFKTALRINPHYELARINLEQLNKATGYTD